MEEGVIMSRTNGYNRESAYLLRKKLAVVRRSIRAGKDVWRNRQRERYLEARLRRMSW